MQAEEKKAGAVPPAGAAAAGPAGKGGKEGSAYIAPALREGGNRRGETMAAGRRSKCSLNINLFLCLQGKEYRKHKITIDFLPLI